MPEHQTIAEKKTEPAKRTLKRTPHESLLLISILKRIPRIRWITTSELLDILNTDGIDINRRMLQRYLKQIVECEELHIEFDDRSRPFAYRQRIPASEIAAMNLRPQESLLLRMFEEHMRYLLPAPLMKSMETLFDRAHTTLNEEAESVQMRAWLKKVAFVSGQIPVIPPAIKPRIFDVVSEALYRESKLYVVYRNLRGEVHDGVASPLGLVQQEHKLYLIVRFDKYQDLRHLALHRMEDAKLLNFSAERPDGFSLDEYIRSRHFNYSNGKKIRLVLEFTSNETALILQESPFTAQQTLEKTEDGAWRLEAVIDDSVLIKGWIASWPDGHFRRIEKHPYP